MRLGYDGLGGGNFWDSAAPIMGMFVSFICNNEFDEYLVWSNMHLIHLRMKVINVQIIKVLSRDFYGFLWAGF